MTGKPDSEFHYICYALKDLVEGPGCVRWQSPEGFRLKDTTEWVIFYNMVSEFEEERRKRAGERQKKAMQTGSGRDS